MTDQLHPDLVRLQQQYMQLVQAVNAQTMSVDQAMASLTAMKAIDGAGYEWSYNTNGELVRAIPGQPGQPTEPWEFSPPQLPPHASDPGLNNQTPFGQQFGQPAPYGPVGQPGAQQASQHGQFGPAAFPGPATTPSPVQFRPQTAGHARSLPSDMPGQQSSRGALLSNTVELLRANLKLIAVGVVCLVLVVVGLGQLRGGDSGPTVADAVPAPPPAPIEVPILPAPTVPAPDAPDGGADDSASSAPDGDRVLQVFSALASADVALLEEAVVSTGSPLSTRLLAAQLAGFASVGLELVADTAVPSGDGQAVQTWRVTDRDTSETLNTVTVTWVWRDGVWLVASIPPLG